MLYNFSIDDLIPLLTIGALLITAIYHTVLYFTNQSKLVGSYSLYLWTALGYLVLAITTVPEKTFKVPSIAYLISSGIFWLSLLLYLKFLLIILDLAKDKENRLYVTVKRTYLITPIYFILRFPYFFFPLQYVATIKACGFIMDTYLFFVFIYLVYLIITNKKRNYKSYVVIGSALMIFFNFFTSITYYTQGYLFGLSHVSFIALGYFSDIIFFSLVVGLQMKTHLRDKYAAIAYANKRELELANEKKKLTDTLLANDFELQTERIKAIMQQRTLIGRKLHDELSGSLVALRYLIGDFKKKASTKVEEERLTAIEQELHTIYKDTRNYSHELAMNIEIAKNKLAYDIPSCLQKLENQFSDIGLIGIHSVYPKEELSRLSTEQNNHVYFFLKESFVNTIKHSKAQHIWVHIYFTPNTCVVNFIDDGLGFATAATEGMGMSNIRNRARDLNAEFEIKTSNQGTILNLTFDIMH